MSNMSHESPDNGVTHHAEHAIDSSHEHEIGSSHEHEIDSSHLEHAIEFATAGNIEDNITPETEVNDKAFSNQNSKKANSAMSESHVSHTPSDNSASHQLEHETEPSHTIAGTVKHNATPKSEIHSVISSRKSSLSSGRTRTRSNSTARSRASDLVRKARLAELKVAQANKEAKQRADEERKQAELKEENRKLEEQRKIRELEYKAERLRLEVQIELDEEKQDPESLANRLHDFDDCKDDPISYSPEIPTTTQDAETPIVPSPTAFTPAALSQPSQLQSSTVRATRLSPSEDKVQPVKIDEQLNDSWVRQLRDDSCGAEGSRTRIDGPSAFTKSLPRLELPRFSGNPLEWPHFISMFKCLVHDQPMTNTQRMTYLQRVLTGDAKKSIGGMLNHGHLYQNALLELEEQFGNEEAIAGAYLRTIFDHPKVPEDDINQLQSLYNTLHIAVETLKGLGYKSDLEATDNVRRAVQKLPSSLLGRWGERKIEISPKVPSLCDFDTWLRTRVRAKASVTQQPANRTPPKPPYKPTGGGGGKHRIEDRHKLPPPVSAFATGIEDANNSHGEKKQCLICSQSHPIENCASFKALNVDQRAQLAKEKRLCFRCLSFPTNSEHLARTCNLRGRCKLENCNRPHHPLIHGAAPVFVGTSTLSSETTVLLQIVPISVRTPKGSTINTFALLDSGSQVSLVLEKFADKIGLEGQSSVLHLGTVNSSPEAKPSRQVSFAVSPIEKTSEAPITVDQAWTVPQLNLPSQKVTRPMIASWPHLNSLDIPEVDSKDVTILLGANVLDAILHREARKGAPGQPVAVRTAFGWTLTGSVKGFAPAEQLHVMLIHRVPNNDDLLNQQLQEWWRTDSFGTKYQHETPRSRDDKKALEILESTVKHTGDRYEAGLLWKEKNVCLPNNRDIAEKRLKSTERTVTRDSVLSEKYCAIIKEYEAKGYARKLSPEEAATPRSKQWFLPHHPVLNPNKPGKVRMVMDAAAKKNGTSLNDNLLIGPDLLNSLTGVVMRFREQRVAIAADIEAMFHQCCIIEEDQPALRFLWRDLESNRAPDVYQMCVMIFGAASSPCTANYVLRKTADDNREDPSFSPDAINAVAKNFYMDDLLKSVEDVPTASRVQQELTSLLARGGFRLTKWGSSSREVLSQIPSKEMACPALNLDLDDLPIERTLGMKWNTESDCLCFSVRLQTPVLSKRGVLSQVSSVFDPLGVLTPYLFIAKTLIQTLWRKRKEWDEPLEYEDQLVWEQWSADLPILRDFQLPRWTSIDTPSNAQVQLHLFGDASEKGFGAVCYIRYLFPDGRIHVSFILAKNRVAPLKQLSIPRLELQAALLAVRLADTAKRELDIAVADTVFWSDSKTVLRYIANESRRFHTFVANRVSEIQDSSDSAQWRYVPSSLNPADDCSRGLNASDITISCRWITGPSFLWQTEDQWPENEHQGALQGNDTEVKTTTWTGVIENDTNCLPDPARFSSWSRYRRAVTWIHRFIHNLQQPKEQRILSPLRAKEIRNAEHAVIRRSQKDSFGKDLEFLKSEKDLPSKSRLLALHPYVDNEGFLRVGGRLRKAPLPAATRNPIILDPSHEVTRLIINHYHQRLYCTGAEHILHEIRQQYWILKGLRAVLKVSHACPLCRRRRSRPNPPVMADLPEARLGYMSPPFTNTGVDYFGPIYVRHGRKTEKRYGALFTCLTTRAVHIEVSHSLDTDSCIMAIRRMIARRGKPSHLWSDCGTNFVGANKELRQALKQWNQAQIENQLAQEGTQWHFNPPASPHFGGAWERLVQSAKKALKAVAGKQLVTDETLLTFLAEVESLLNSRPLTHVGSDHRDEEALTPNHFLIGRASVNLPVDVVTDRDLCSRKRWRHAQVMTNHFWKRWLREYVPSLTERRKWKRDAPSLAEGDLVLVVDENSPRGRWPLGRVVRALPGDDGNVRAAEVRTSSGTYVRPVAKICLLEENTSTD